MKRMTDYYEIVVHDGKRVEVEKYTWDGEILEKQVFDTESTLADNLNRVSLFIQGHAQASENEKGTTE